LKKNIAILGSTGSIGTQALEVIASNPEQFRVELITANNNVDLLIRQAMAFLPAYVVIGNKTKYAVLKEALAGYPVKVFAGTESVSQLMSLDSIDMVLTAMVGYSGLLPTIKALESKKTIALANKETLVVAGDLIMNMAMLNDTPVIPVDSEHSAIFQCLVGEHYNHVEKIYLTASGGPFRGKDIAFLKTVTKQQALKHPNWEMGAKITIDSASLMNKGLEAIEAKWLFNLQPSQIDVIVHPQSIIHSLVQFEDGSLKAQMGLPDMKLPIQYALAYPYRLKSTFPRFSFMDYPLLSFEKPDVKTFRNLEIALFALKTGGNIPCIMNAANEIVVDAFLHDKVGFFDMSDIISETINRFSFVAHPNYFDYVAFDSDARMIAAELITKHKKTYLFQS